jgi:hypothetical protein
MADVLELLNRIPAFGRFRRTAIPDHPICYPTFSPLGVAYTTIIIRYAELETTGWADFVRAATGLRRTRRLTQIWKSTDGADKIHDCLLIAVGLPRAKTQAVYSR